MLSLLIIMYILSANGFNIPTGCWIAVWIFTGLSVLLAAIKAFWKE